MGEHRELDEYQRRAVECDRNAVVAAGAGSGKTTVLANRYLRLVRDRGAGVESILTLTFTRKAAAEMYERIYRLLQGSADHPQVSRELARFERAHISTLDSFCSQIVRNWPQRFGIVQEFAVDEVAAREVSEQVSLDFMLRHQANASLSSFIAANSFERLWKEFFADLAAGYIHMAEQKDFSAMFRRQIAELRDQLTLRCRRIGDLFKKIQGIDPKAGASVRNAQAVVDARSLFLSLAESESYQELQNEAESLRFRKSGGKSPELVLLDDCIEQLRVDAQVVAEIASSLANAGVTEGMMQLCASFQEEVIAARRNAGALFYHDVVHMAVRILQENTELRQHYKRQFKYIMIDEFQDNNDLQKNLLYLLAEREDRCSPEIPKACDLDQAKLFFVGDEKQSIYMFRGADVSVFKRLSDEMAELGGVSLSLPTNYRSEPGLIDFYNELFGAAMTDSGRDYEARFNPLEKRAPLLDQPATIRVLHKPYVEKTDEGTASQDDAEAYAIGTLIREAVSSGSLPIYVDGEQRAAGYDDIAVLMRSTSNQIRYERVFRLIGIPYTVQSARSLFLEAPMNDLYCLFQLVIYPDDRAAYAGFLRSPFANVSDATMVRLLQSNAPPLEIAEGVDAFIGESDRRKLDAARELYGFMRSGADRCPIAELLFHAWYTYGYRYHLLKNPDYHAYLEHYNYVRAMALDADRRGRPLAVFLDFLRPNLGLYERLPELEMLKEEQNGVQIMTIHKAKGLEFPVVILANSGNRGRSWDAAPYYVSNEFGLTLNTVVKVPGEKTKRHNYFYTLGKQEAADKDLAELKRLLYVALTRAQCHLFVSGSHNRQNRSSDDVMLNLVLSALGIPEGSGEPSIDSVTVDRIPDIPEERLYIPLAPSRRRSPAEMAPIYSSCEIVEYRLRRLEWTATEVEELVRETVGYGEVESLPGIACDPVLKDQGLDAVFGTLCHHVMQESLGGHYDRRRIPASLLGRFDDSHRETILLDAERLCADFLKSPLGRTVESSASVKTELPFILRDDRSGSRVFISGQVDLLVGGTDKPTVIDFKTDSQLRRGEYYAQLQVYRQAVRAITGKEPECLLVYLRGMHVVTVPSVELPPLPPAACVCRAPIVANLSTPCLGPTLGLHIKA